MTTSFQKIMLLGDSLTQTSMEGWGGGLAHIYQRRADVYNRGMSGYNTRWYLPYAQSDAKIFDIDDNVMLTTIFFGANDASLVEHNPHAHVPLDEFKLNIQRLIELSLTKFPNTYVLVITPPPVIHSQRLQYQKDRYGDKATGVLERTLENTGKYASAVREVVAAAMKSTKTTTNESVDHGTTVRIACLNLYDGMLAEGSSKCDDFFYDGLHFSPAGHKFVLKEIQSALHKHFPKIAVTPCPHTGQWNNSGSKCEVASSGPYHDAIQHDRWEAAFGGGGGGDDDAK
mmetsp:Transcript_22253/g.63099  ORF Transcript_22253/g.63099 Transcript_22253/m.63099 type:complete len:286 (-) Transcript_22253:10-867(-)